MHDDCKANIHPTHSIPAFSQPFPQFQKHFCSPRYTLQVTQPFFISSKNAHPPSPKSKPPLLIVFLDSRLFHNPGHLLRQIIRLPPRRRLGVHPNRILCPARSGKTPTVLILADQSVDLRLHARRTFEFPFGVEGLEDVAVCDFDAHEPVWEVGVGEVPFLGAPAFVGEDDFDEEEVGEGVADGLVDEVG